MIRDEFNSQVKKSKYTAKELGAINKSGERTFLAFRIMKMSNNIKGFNVSTVFCAITVFLGAILVALTLISGYNEFNTSFIVTSSLVGVLGLWCLIWWLILAPGMKRKIKRFKERLEEIKIEELKRKNH